MRSRTPPISSEFRGGLNHPKPPPSLRHCVDLKVFIASRTVTLRGTVPVCASVCQSVGHELSEERSDVSDCEEHNCETVREKRDAMKYDVPGATPAVSAVRFKNEWVVRLFPLYSKMPRIEQRNVHLQC